MPIYAISAAAEGPKNVEIIDETSKTMVYHIERSSFPNWDGSEQKRPFTVTANELRYTNPAPSSGGPAAQLIWKRAP